MNKAQLKQIILDQKIMPHGQSSSKRDIEKDIAKYLKTDLIVIITGMRRVGKSTLLQHIRKKYDDNDFYMDFDDERLITFSVDDFQVLFELFIELFGSQQTFFFDEIQNILGWERFARRLHNQGYKVFITGSNAKMLSKELGTHLTGRYSNITLYPFSFNEFLQRKAPELLKEKHKTSILRSQIKNKFNDYLKIGGLPHQVVYDDAEYLSVLYENIIYRDIMTRNNINSEHAVKTLTHYLASNIGKEVSFNNLKTIINVSNHSTVSEYCHLFENSFLCYLINAYDYSLKKQIRRHKKIYFNDVAMAAKIGFRHSDDYGRILENIVFIELRRRNKEIYFHQKIKECDFIIKEDNKITCAYQVTSSLECNKTKAREYNGLLEAMQQYNLCQGYILTDDFTDEEVIEKDNRNYKIIIKPIWEWLLEE